MISSLQSRADFIAFVDALRRDLDANPAAWENPTLDSYLAAVSAWTTDMDGFYKNQGLPVPEAPSWQTFAHIMLGATLYE
ncbi:MAG TPA: hypothetical protein VK066_31105 [Chloroflexota bacterium]|nr:hypothetical protein [Chloroflexota bacterium]